MMKFNSSQGCKWGGGLGLSVVSAKVKIKFGTRVQSIWQIDIS